MRLPIIIPPFSFRLRLFQKFDQFRILVCGGDGSIGWVLSEIDKLDLHRQVGSRWWVGGGGVEWGGVGAGFDQFSILVCGGDGSIGWILSEIDKLDLHRQVGSWGGGVEWDGSVWSEIVGIGWIDKLDLHRQVGSGGG